MARLQMDATLGDPGYGHRYPTCGDLCSNLHHISDPTMPFATRLLTGLCLFSVTTIEQRTWAMGGGAPTALHQILAQADVVAVATVSASDHAPDGTPLDSTLHVKRVIHGTLEDKRILVVNDDLNACMGPPANYVVGERVLVFLNHQKGVGYTTCGYLYGARVLDDHSLVASIRRIQEFYRIRSVKDDAQRTQRWAEWAVRCAEDSSTQRDALALLCRGTHGKLGSMPMPNEPTEYFRIIDVLQQQRLLNILKRVPGNQNGHNDHGDLMRVIAFSIQDQALLKIANSTTDLVRSNDVKTPKRVFAAKLDSLVNDFITRYNVVQVQRTQKLSP